MDRCEAHDPAHAGGDVAARDLLELHIRRPSVGSRLVRWTAVVGSNLALEGHGARHPGGSTAVVIDSRTGRTVCEVDEAIDDDGTSEFARLVADFETESLADFLRRWATDGT